MTSSNGQLQGRVDVAVVGAGIIGLSAAYELLRTDAKRFGRTVVIDRGLAGAGATQASAGMIAPVSEAEIQDRAVVEFGLDSAHRYADFVGGLEQLTGLSCGYRRHGTLWAAADRDEVRQLEHIQALQRDKGVSSKLLSAKEILALEPHLSQRVTGGLQVEGDHHVDPRRLVQTLTAALTKLGGQLAENRSVECIFRNGDAWSVSGTDAMARQWRIDADIVILAAGAWAEQSIETPLPTLGLRPVKGQAMRLAFEKGAPLLTHVIRSPRVYMVPTDDGNLIVGATSEEQWFDEASTAGAVMDLLRYAWRLLPGLYDLPVQELMVGFRPCLRDHQPAIGAVSAANCPGLYVAVGHFRDGILLTPATAHHLAELICTGRQPSALKPFSPDRLLHTAGRAGGVEHRQHD